MAYRHIEPRKVLDESLTGPGAQVFGEIHDMRTMTRGALQFNYGTGLSADMAVYASVDGENFFDLQVGIPSCTGTAGSYGVDLTAFGYPYYRPAVTPTGGAGTMEVWANAKGS